MQAEPSVPRTPQGHLYCVKVMVIVSMQTQHSDTFRILEVPLKTVDKASNMFNLKFIYLRQSKLHLYDIFSVYIITCRISFTLRTIHTVNYDRRALAEINFKYMSKYMSKFSMHMIFLFSVNTLIPSEKTALHLYT